jgi:hypothetical protein
MYYLIILTSVFILFAIIFINRYKFNNLLNLLKSIAIFKIKCFDKSKSDMILSCDKKSNFNSENLDDLIEKSVNIKIIKKVSFDINTNFEPKQPIKKTKSQNNIFIPQHEKLISYSYTYGDLSKLVPNGTTSKVILDELIKNKNNNIMSCCNPYCKKKIIVPQHFAFDGYYCDEHCRHFVCQNIDVYWRQLYGN